MKADREGPLSRPEVDWTRCAERLQRGHAAILLTVSRLQDVVRSYSQSRPLLHDLYEDLLAHWEWQTADSFAALSSRHARDRTAVKMCEFLVHDLKDLKVAFLVFFDTHSGDFGDTASRRFSGEAVEFSRKITARVQVEEEYLLPLLRERDDQS